MTTVSYETDAPNAYEWTSKAFDYLVDGKLSASVEKAAGIRTAVVRGECPRCSDTMNFSQVLDAVSGESLTTRGPSLSTRDAGYLELTVSCCCTEPHDGRPASVTHGCGINFRVDVASDAQ